MAFVIAGSYAIPLVSLILTMVITFFGKGTTTHTLASRGITASFQMGLTVNHSAWAAGETRHSSIAMTFRTPSSPGTFPHGVEVSANLSSSYVRGWSHSGIIVRLIGNLSDQYSRSLECTVLSEEITKLLGPQLLFVFFIVHYCSIRFIEYRFVG
jgi:hypothetical protein